MKPALGFRNGLRLVLGAAKRNEDGVRVLKIEREKKFFPRRAFIS
jgi:hypothetical protein